MHDDRSLVEDRIERLRERVGREHYRVLASLDVAAWQVPGEPVPFEQASAAQYRPFPVGTWWGPAWSTWWLRITGQIPAEARDLAVSLRVDLGFVGDWAGNQSEGMVFTTEGRALKAVNPMNRLVGLNHGQFSGVVSVDGTFTLFVEAGANPDMTTKLGEVTQYGDTLTRPDEPLWRFGGADLVVRNDEVWALSLDLEILDDLMRELPAEDTHRAVLLRGLEEAADAVDAGEIVATAAKAREILAPLIASGANRSAQTMHAVGHAHIDSAWLWPIRETKRKVLRTFSNVTALAEQYPEFNFSCTSAQHYAWLQEASPEVFERVRAAIARGQWHVTGGMWVESDTNLPGGEALVRQFTSGLRYFAAELGVRPDCLWLPDSFGYSGALPQIARLAGMKWFFTQKLSWNRTNSLPHHTFWWEGIDGTRIWTHFPPVDCYDSIVSVKEVRYAQRNFKEKGRASHSLLPYGYGDGGGGPVPEMLERARRLADLEDAPRVRNSSPEEFFAQASAEYPDAPVWAGELYLEFHRGVYTTMHALKRGNRQAEAGLRAVELAGVWAELAGGHYPAAELELLWRRALLLQFHDILPGSSTSWVNREAEAEYRQINAELELLLSKILPGGGPGIGLLNASDVPRREVIVVDEVPELVTAPAHAVVDLESARTAAQHEVSLTEVDGQIVLDNGLLRVSIDQQGLVRSIVDLGAQRELIPAGAAANLLTVHPDQPSCFDAWELQHQYLRQATELRDADEVRTSLHPLLASVQVTRSVGQSRLVQTISLAADSTALDFELWVDWRERARVLKTSLPVAVAARTSQAEIQFGHIERPVPVNTSWDAAKFETSGHRWLRLAEPGYAVAVANDSSYGHHVFPGASPDTQRGVTIGLTLLRSPQSPDPLADLGEHRLRYCLVADASLDRARAAGERLNQPLRLLSGGAERPTLVELSPVNESSSAAIDAVKCAFDDSGDVIVRLHEAAGARSRVALDLSFPAAEITEVDLLEDPVDSPTQSLSIRDDGEAIELSLRPFQILTLRIRRKK